MPIDKATPLGEIAGYYRTTLIAALRTFSKAVAKTRKDEEDISGVTEHLDDFDEIVDEFRVALGAKTAESMEGTPLGRAMREGENKHFKKKGDPAQFDLLPEGIDVMDDEVIAMMLEIVHYDAKPDEMRQSIAGWDHVVRSDVYRWARAMQLAGDPQIHVHVPRRPNAVPVTWLSLYLDVVHGKLDPETLQPVVEMNADEIAAWIERGPWAPRTIVVDEVTKWVLAWNGPLAEGETSPPYAFVHDSEGEARLLAATINRRLADTGDDTPAAPTPPTPDGPNDAPAAPTDSESSDSGTGTANPSEASPDTPSDTPKRRGKRKT
jgi:hypothetical protein